MIAAIVAPSWERSKLRTGSCLEVPMRERETRAAFCLVLNLARFETLERERGFAFDLAIKDLRGRRHHRRTTSTPPSYPRGPVLRRSPAASVTDSNAPFPGEVQQNTSNLVARLLLSWAVPKSALLELSPTSRTTTGHPKRAGRWKSGSSLAAKTRPAAGSCPTCRATPRF